MAPVDHAHLPPTAQGIESALIGWNSPEVTADLTLARFLGLETDSTRRFPPQSGVYIDQLASTGALLRSLNITESTNPERFVNAVAAAFGGQAGPVGGWRGIIIMSLDSMRSINPDRTAAIERLRDAATANRIPHTVERENRRALRTVVAWDHTYHWFDDEREQRMLDDLLDHKVDSLIDTAIIRCGAVEAHRDAVMRALKGRS